MAKNIDDTAQNASGDESQVESAPEVASAEVLATPEVKKGYQQETGAFNF